MAVRTTPTYREYERRRLGNPANELEGIVTMFRRAFGAASFAAFWRYWNPLFSYYLSYKCYRPLARFLPRSLAVILTFAASGAIHDFFASLARRHLVFLFIPIFATFGLLVVLEKGLGLNMAWAPTWLRALIHATLIVGPVLAGLAVRSMWL